MEVQVSTGNGFPGQGSVVTAERPQRPDPEVREKAKHRHFSAQEKRRILLEAEEATKVQGGLGALLRREGIYSSHLYLWRKQRERGEIEGLSPKKRGKRSAAASPEVKRLRALEKENRRLQRKLKKAELIIEVQKKLSEILNVPLPPIPPDAEEEDD